MAKKLILIRHSYAENGSFDTNDFERNLTERGNQFILTQIAKLKQDNVIIDKVISSDANRAKQTTQLICDYLPYTGHIQYEHFLYCDYTTQDFIDFIASFDNELETIAIVAHNPTIANIAYRLCNKFNHSVPPGTIIILEFNGQLWQELKVNSTNLLKVIS